MLKGLRFLFYRTGHKFLIEIESRDRSLLIMFYFKIIFFSQMRLSLHAPYYWLKNRKL